jgi:formamidopyrimidine-DNA glycosylase
MPELPEVESLRRILSRSLVGRRVISVTIAEARLRRAISSDLANEIVDSEILRLSRRAKYLLIELHQDRVMMVHLGMSGSLTHRHSRGDFNGFDPRHDHVTFTLDDGSLLIYNDPRRFGLMKLVARAELDLLPELAAIGPEPFGTDFNANYLWKISRGRTGAIKNLLMDQRIVAGIGNIYASEILFRAGVRPTRRAGKVTRDEIARIAAITPQVLREAIGSGGTTFRSYRDSQGQPGRFAQRLRVYDREGEPCLTCSSPIRAVVVGQRSSFFCPRCQK